MGHDGKRIHLVDGPGPGDRHVLAGGHVGVANPIAGSLEKGNVLVVRNVGLVGDVHEEAVAAVVGKVGTATCDIDH